MIHQPHDLLRLDFTKRERAELVENMRKVAVKSRELLNGLERAETNAVGSVERLNGLYRVTEARGYRLAAQLDEDGTTVLKADDVRFLRAHSPIGSRGFKACQRVWEREAVR